MGSNWEIWGNYKSFNKGNYGRGSTKNEVAGKLRVKKYGRK